MLVIGDTDILSSFGKAGSIKLLKRLFGKIYVPQAVLQELLRTKQLGYLFIDSILREIDVIILSKEEFKEFEVILESETSLHAGEIQGIVICESRDGILLTNDKLVKKYCDRHRIQYLDMEEILRSLKVKDILSEDELIRLIDKIEIEDRTIIKAKDSIIYQ